MGPDPVATPSIKVKKEHNIYLNQTRLTLYKESLGDRQGRQTAETYVYSHTDTEPHTTTDSAQGT